MSIKNKILISMVILLSFAINLIEPKAATLKNPKETCYDIDLTTGKIYTDGNRTYDCLKYIDNKTAYCVELEQIIYGTNPTYVTDSSLNKASKKAITMGYIIELANEKYSSNSAINKYSHATSVLNAYARKNLKYEYALNFAGKQSYIQEILDKATEKVNAVNLTKTLPTPTIKVTNSVFNYDNENNFYLSDKVTISNLKETYGGDSVSYTISVNKDAKICTSSTGKDSTCSNSKVISGKTSYSFYVKATNLEASDEVTITVKGSNKSTYPSVQLYKHQSATSQKVVVKTSVTYERTTKNTTTLVIPNTTNHTIQAIKVDENGETLSGATLEIYQDAAYTGTKLASGTGSSIKYTSPTLAEADDDFFNHDYFLVETAAPNGYVLNSTVNQFSLTNTSKKTICYYNGGSESDESTVVTDAERCNFAAYQYKCQGTDGSIKDLKTDGTCIFESPSPVEEDNTPNEDEGTTPGEGATPGEDTPTQPPEISYAKICYNVDTNKEVTDETYCSNKDNYTKIVSTNGNLVVTQVNQKNKLSISKMDITGKKEVEGASLKICTSTNYEKDKENCTSAKTIEDVVMEWISTTQPQEFQGIPTGEYYIIETLPPAGYKKVTTASKFKVDKNGKITANEKEVSNSIVINNQINNLTISKQDIATSKELPGATISICVTKKDEETGKYVLDTGKSNECVPVILADGTKATWVSSKEPHKIEGLPAGTYYLVEMIAPTDYDLAESILFTMTESGEILDENNKPIGENKIVMHDKPLEQKQTGDIKVIAIIVIGLAGLISGLYCYKYTNKNYNFN